MDELEFKRRYIYNPQKDKLGEGGYGAVYKAKDKYRNREVAIKVSAVRSDSDKSLLREFELFKRVKPHENLAHYEVCYRFSTTSGVNDYAILDFYPEGNLRDLIRAKGRSLGKDQKLEISKGIMRGLRQIHKYGLIHRDLKSANILIDKSETGEFIPKIADFGLVKETVGDGISNSNPGGGTLFYMAPEQFKAQKLRANLDIWSLGVVLFELYTGRLPFLTKDHAPDSEAGRAEFFSQILNAEIPESLKDIPEPIRSVIEKCLVPDPDKRVKGINELGIDLGDEYEFDLPTDPPPLPKPKVNWSGKWLWMSAGAISVVLGVWVINSGIVPSLQPDPDRGSSHEKTEVIRNELPENDQRVAEKSKAEKVIEQPTNNDRTATPSDNAQRNTQREELMDSEIEEGITRYIMSVFDNTDKSKMYERIASGYADFEPYFTEKSIVALQGVSFNDLPNLLRTLVQRGGTPNSINVYISNHKIELINID